MFTFANQSVEYLVGSFFCSLRAVAVSGTALLTDTGPQMAMLVPLLCVAQAVNIGIAATRRMPHV